MLRQTRLVQPRGRRLSAPPVFGGFTGAAAAPLERQLQFTASISPQQQAAGGVLGRLATLAEEEGEDGHQGQTGGPMPASVPPPPREGAVMVRPGSRELLARPAKELVG